MQPTANNLNDTVKLIDDFSKMEMNDIINDIIHWSKVESNV